MFRRMFKPISIFFLVTVVFVALLASPVAVYAQVTDPLLVILAFNDAGNAHDVNAELALIADDAVANFPGQSPDVYTGKDQIRTWLHNDAADNIHIESRNHQVVGDKVTWVGTISSDSIRNIGVSFIEGPAEALVQEGKIKSFTFTLNQESLAKLEAFPVIIALHEANNAHNMDAMLAFFTDDAVANFPDQPPPNVLTGKEQIRTGWLEGDFANNIHIEVRNLQMAGDKVTWMATISWDFLRPFGIASLEGGGEAVVQEGKIKSFTAIFPPESMAKLVAVSLITALQEGANAHKDINAMVDFFTDDAVVTFKGQPPPDFITGKEEIRAWQQSEFADNSHIECGNLKVSGDKATWTLKYSSDSLLKLDVVPPPLESEVESVIQEGKFKSLSVAFDPESLAKLNATFLVIAFHEANNDHDMDAMLAFFTDDAVANFPGQSPDVYAGKEQIRTWLQNDFADNIHIDVENLQVAGDKLTWIGKISTDSLRELGIDSLESIGEAVVQEGKIKSFTATFPPESLAKLECAIAKSGEDFSHVFFMSLDPGLNMVSLPLKPSQAYTARSFASELGATVVIKYDEVKGRFEGFAVNATGDGFPIEGGKGYIINAPKGGTFTFTGAAWTNEPPVKGAPPAIQVNSAWAFVVNGSVLDGDIMSVGSGNYTVTVRNLNTSMVVSESISSDRYFAGTYADLSRKAVIKSGDKIEVAVTDSSGELVSGPFIHAVSQNEITNAFLNVHLRLGDIVPKKTALLQNFPNPFNPETWIPFQLRNASDVTITIFNADGRLVRTLELGRRDPGIYASQIKAAHWDGKNDSGEKIASGVYFYNITAGDFSATRKMIVKK